MSPTWWPSIVAIPVLAVALGWVRRKHNGKPVTPVSGTNRSRWRQAVLIAVILNFGVWGIGTIALHGDAVNGKSEQGAYFLSWKGHYTAVSRGVYLYSYIHTGVTMASFPLAIILLALADLRRR